MKSSLFLVALFLAAGLLSARAQTINLNVCYDEVEFVRGELYQYSERYLGTKQALTESGTTFTLRLVSVLEPDTAAKKAGSRFGRSAHETPRNEKNRTQTPHLPALSEDALLASSTAKKAEIVAKQIYRIREARMAILSGESEHAPADGKAMELALKGLNRQEEELTSLFLGTTNTTPHVRNIEYTLSDSIGEVVEDIMFRFSQFTGPVSADDLSGEPVHIVRYNQLAQRPSSRRNAKKGEMETYIAGSRIEILFEGRTIMEYKLPDSKPAVQNKK